MALLAVQQAGASVALRAGAVVVVRSGEVLATRPLHEVGELHLYGSVDLTADARDALLGAGADVLFLTSRGQYRGRLVGEESKVGERRLAQVRFLSDDGKRLGLARALVAGKLANQRQLLMRAGREHPERACPEVVAALRRIVDRAHEASDLGTLRGVEGWGAALYFKGFGRALSSPHFRFDGRNRRPPRDPVNSCLSFGYMLLGARAAAAVQRAGLDPCIGALHDAGRGRAVLAFDLMEEMRPVVVDRTVLRLFNRRQLGPDDFADPPVNVSVASAPPPPDAHEPGGRPGEQSEPSALGSGEAGTGQTQAESPLPPPGAAVAAAPEMAAPGPPRAVYLADTGRTIFLRELAQTWRATMRDESRGASYSLEHILEHQAMRLAHAFERAEPYEPFLLR